MDYRPTPEGYLRSFLAKVPAAEGWLEPLEAGGKGHVRAKGEAAPADPAALFARLAAILDDKRAKTFALKGFDRKALPAWSGPDDAQHGTLAAYVAEREIGRASCRDRVCQYV